MKSPFESQRFGESGIGVSDIFPWIGIQIDDFFSARSMWSASVNLPPSTAVPITGRKLCGGSRPPLGSWHVYGLGSNNRNLPGFVALRSGAPVRGARNWLSSSFSTQLQGAWIRTDAETPNELIQGGANTPNTRAGRRRQLELLDRLDSSFRDRVGFDPRPEANIESTETAFQMQTEAPGIFDLSDEYVRSHSGDGAYGCGCLMTLRTAEAGVRVSQVGCGEGQPWNSHGDIMTQKTHAQLPDGPIAAPVEDLQDGGMFDDTLVIVGGEFARTPMIPNSGTQNVGLGGDLNPPGYSIPLAGGGTRGGQTFGVTDEFGHRAVKKPVNPHALHAAALRLLGWTKLTRRHNAGDIRRTDVDGHVIREWVA